MCAVLRLGRAEDRNPRSCRAGRQDRERTALLSLLAAASLAFGAHAAPTAKPALTNWDAKKNGSPKVYKQQGLTLTARRGKAGPVLTVSDGKAKPLSITGAETPGDTVTLDFGAFALDRRLGGAQVLVSSFTFGAHCCFRYQLATKRGGAWTVRTLGEWDGAGMPMPRDIDGDGRLELLAGDQSFLYAFDSYAGSDVPAQVFEVHNGRLIDVSTQPRYRAAYEADLVRQKEACELGEPGVCAAYAATLARLGRVAEVWPLVEKAKPGQGGANPEDPAIWLPGGKKRVFKNFRESLEWFLADRGYIPMTEKTPSGRLVDTK